MLIGLVGKKQVGKDTVANYLVHHYGFIKHAFAAPLKAACEVLFLLEPRHLNDNRLKEKTDARWDKTPRQMMQLVGTDLFRKHVDRDFWVKHMDLWLDAHHSDLVVISDVRFQNEADLIKKRGGLLWRVEREMPYHDAHESETQEIRNVDLNLDNNRSVNDLYHQIDLSIRNTS